MPRTTWAPLLDEHLGYVGDRARLEQFKAAIGRVVQPGHRVADLGCGTGVLGLLCLQAGASHVFAIDASPMIEIARQTLTRAGMGDRATFIRDMSQRVDLAERVDVVICDHVGYFGVDYGIVEMLQDARRRFLSPGGTLMPATIRLELSAVESDKARANIDGWQAPRVPAQFHWVRNLATNATHGIELARDALLAEPVELGDLDFRGDIPEFVRWSATLQFTRGGLMHGLAGWFRCELAEGVWMSNSPLDEGVIDRPQAFLPIDEAVPVSAGDRVTATVMMRPSDDLIAWDIEFHATGRRMRQSTWQSMLLTPDERMRTRPDCIPRINPEGRARLVVLGYCDGLRTAREIEQAVLREHPQLFPSAAEASRFIARVLARDAG